MAERREEKARLIYGSDKEESESKTDTLKLPATFIGESDLQEPVEAETKLYVKDPASSMENYESESGEESECEYRGVPLTGAIDNEEEYDLGPGHLGKIMEKKDRTNTKGGWKKKMGSSKKKDWIGLN
ncbi:hypothetical protein D4764_02G0003500 [Takifugu flavidus]|uniref:Uncharacterized protein n=1 Tax=Takifugu flavidus TaxID=433684 RepID=A0A5C6NKY2_9TELE|nr:hypothetical protein D4764_02G0003500 [Takifugu flavidus]